MPIAFPPTPYFREPLLSGDAGVEQTINQMRELADEALHDPSIIRLATDIVRSAPAFDEIAEARALYDWVHGNIRFTKDPVNKEKLYPPAELLKIRAGDCDDIAMLLGVLLMAVGYPARLVTVAVSGQAEQFSHVYTEGEVPAHSGQWVAMDPARYDSEFGVPPPVVTRARWWSLSDNSYGEQKLGYYPRFRSHVSGMGSYGRVKTMGDDGTSSTIATISQGTADIIRASQGQPASPFDYSSSGPWQSFQTQYSPYGPPGGYPNAPGVQLTTSSNVGLWLVMGIGALLLFGGRR
jgi:Transglutaminase-like superfamily